MRPTFHSTAGFLLKLPNEGTERCIFRAEIRGAHLLFVYWKFLMVFDSLFDILLLQEMEYLKQVDVFRGECSGSEFPAITKHKGRKMFASQN